MARRHAGIVALSAAGLLLTGGAVAFTLIIAWRGPSDTVGDALAPAAQTLLAAVVAAFGLSQISIAQKSVEVTEDQNQIMRDDARDAALQAAQRTQEAADALLVAKMERLDAFAPKVALVGEANFTMPQVGVHILGSGGVAEKLVIDEVEAQSRTFRYSAVVTLKNFDQLPVRWESTPQMADEASRGVLLPGGEHQFYVDETYSLAVWHERIETFVAQSEAERGGRGLFRRSVTVSGASNFVRDTHTVALFQPPLRREGTYYVLEPGKPQVEPLGELKRAYDPTQL